MFYPDKNNCSVCNITVFAVVRISVVHLQVDCEDETVLEQNYRDPNLVDLTLNIDNVEFLIRLVI